MPLLVAAGHRPWAVAGASQSGSRGATVPLRVRERSRATPLALDLLDGALELGFVAAGSLPSVVRALERAGNIVLVRSDPESERLAYFAQRARLTLSPPTSAPSEIRPPRPAAEPPSDARGPSYEEEGSSRRAVGSVAVAADAWWSATLSAPEDGGPLLLTLERHGAAPERHRAGDVAELSLPASEIDAIVALISGVVAQARRDGVLPARPS